MFCKGGDIEEEDYQVISFQYFIDHTALKSDRTQHVIRRAHTRTSYCGMREKHRFFVD